VLPLSRHDPNASFNGISSLVSYTSCICLQEVYGEDPFLSGRLAAAYVKGIQGRDPRFVRASSGCKVVGLYSGPEDKPQSRFSFNAVVSNSYTYFFNSSKIACLRASCFHESFHMQQNAEMCSG
jgi:hypothetical protein